MGTNAERPQWLSFKEAVAWARVSRQRLNQAIWRGEIEAERGGPGIKARINYQSLNHWLYERGLLTRTPEPSTRTTLERLDRLVESLDHDHRLERLQHQYDALSGLVEAMGRHVEAIGHSVDLAFTHLKEEGQRRVEELQQAQARVQRLEEAQQVATLLQSVFGSPDPEAPSTRQVGTVGSVLSLLVREGRSYRDQDVAAFLAPERWDAGVVQRCLDQLRADGRYQQLMDRTQS